MNFAVCLLGGYKVRQRVGERQRTVMGNWVMDKVM